MSMEAGRTMVPDCAFLFCARRRSFRLVMVLMSSRVSGVERLGVLMDHDEKCALSVLG